MNDELFDIKLFEDMMESILKSDPPGKAVDIFLKHVSECGELKPQWLEDLVGNLAYDLEFYVENEANRREDPVYFGPERLEREVQTALGVIRRRGE
jgi:hypothetical protein